jgi:glutamine cyclotransferase
LNPDPERPVNDYVLNGIAYDRETGHLLVTGKCCPHLYEIELVPNPPGS